VRATYQNAVESFKARGLLVDEHGKLRLAGDARRLVAEIADLLPPE
jgi:hypothetical protein